MGYIEDNLIPGEKVLLRAYTHWATFILPAVPLLSGLVIVVLSFNSQYSTSLACLGMLFLLIGLLQCLRVAVISRTTEFALTDRRIIAKTGLLTRASLELQLAKVESIRVMQPLMGRLFDYGTITVVGTGGTRQPIPFIGHPNALRIRVNAKLAELQ